MATQEKGDMIGRYKEYKRKTKGLIHWLTRTAAECCDLNKVVRSLAAGALDSSRAYEVRTSELPKLAESISSNKAAVPEGILLIIKDILAHRQGCSEWYEAHTLNDDMANANESHRHYINVLWQTLQILEGARMRNTDATKQQSGMNPKAAIGSLFEALELEEPSAEPLGREPTPSTSSKPTRRLDASFKLEDAEDGAFKTWCFLRDLLDIRTSVKDIWKEYAAGDISFAAAGIYTDAAFGLLRRAGQDFASISPFGPEAHWPKLLEYLGISYFVKNNIIWLHPNAGSHAKEPSSELNITELLCPVAFECLQCWKQDAAEWHNAQDRFEQAGPDTMVIFLPGNPQIHPLCQRFRASMGRIHVSAHRPPEESPTDEFTRILIEVHLNASVPAWAVVGCQIAMDLDQFLGDHRSNGIVQVREECALINKRFADVEKHSSTGQRMTPSLQKSFGHMRDSVKKLSSWIQAPSKDGRVPQVPGAEFSRLSDFPTLAGDSLTAVKIGHYHIATKFACHGNSVLSVAHAYRALRAMGLLEHRWEDMEFAIASFAPKDPLVPRERGPHNPEQANRQYMMACGFSLTEVQQLPKRVQATGEDFQLLNVRQAARGFEIASPLLAALLQHHTIRRRTEPNSTLDAIVEALVVSDDTTVIKQKHQRNSRSRPSFTACDLLATLKKRLIRDEPTLNFDFIGFTVECARLLDELTSQVIRIEESKADMPEDQFHERFVQLLLLGDRNDKGWAATALFFDPYIRAHGKNYVKSAYDRSSSRIPKALRPSIKPREETARKTHGTLCDIFDKTGMNYSCSGPMVAVYFTDRKASNSTGGQGDKASLSSHESIAEGYIGQTSSASTTPTPKPFFGPPRPPGM